MKILGIDYGAKKIGLAIGDTESRLAEPMTILRYKDIKRLSEKVKKAVEAEKVDLVVIGISEGESAKKTKVFGEELSSLGVNITYQDETLSTYEAQVRSLEAGIGRKKRKEMEDAYSAAIILQDFLNNPTVA